MTIGRRRKWFFAIGAIVLCAVVVEFGFDASAYWRKTIRGRVVGGEPARSVAGATVIVKTAAYGLARPSNEHSMSYSKITQADGTFEIHVRGSPRAAFFLHPDFYPQIVKLPQEEALEIGLSPLPPDAPRTATTGTGTIFPMP